MGACMSEQNLKASVKQSNAPVNQPAKIVSKGEKIKEHEIVNHSHKKHESSEHVNNGSAAEGPDHHKHKEKKAPPMINGQVKSPSKIKATESKS